MSIQGLGYIAISVAVGVAVIALGLYQRVRLRASERWLPAVGTITKSDLVIEQSGESKEYIVRVSYEYVANGRRYTSERLEFGHSTYLRKKNAQATLDRFPAKTSVMVYFNPAKPEDAVLVRKSSYSLSYVLIGLLVVCFSLASAFFSSFRN